jgi:hypothetical protein
VSQDTATAKHNCAGGNAARKSDKIKNHLKRQKKKRKRFQNCERPAILALEKDSLENIRNEMSNRNVKNNKEMLRLNLSTKNTLLYLPCFHHSNSTNTSAVFSLNIDEYLYVSA